MIKKNEKFTALMALFGKQLDRIRRLFGHGFSAALLKVKRKLWNMYRAGKRLYSKAELNAQRNTVFSRKITFSILVPLYNTPEKFLREMIQSVLDQTYADWELCLADGSDAAHAYVETICNRFANQDQRIRYQKLERNQEISGNTNACIQMATGDFFALFDHDDLLHPAALFHVMKAICEKHADFIYTDENTFRKTPKDAYAPHFKPDFAPDTLRSYNYICHFTVFDKTLLEKAGGVVSVRNLMAIRITI